MGFQKIDKKQMPQVIGLGAASVGMFGYFAYKMMVPTVSAAVPPAAARTAQAVTPGAAASPAPVGAAPAVTTDTPDAPTPTPGMHDPFIPTITDQDAPAGSAPATPAHPIQMVSNRGIKSDPLFTPYAPPLPSPGRRGGGATFLPPMNGGGSPGISTPDSVPAGGLAPMPAAPTWTVTGVLQGGGEQIAILRSGEVREFAHRGEIVGGNFRVVDVTRNYVVLRHGTVRYTLPLGGPKTPDAKTRKAAQPSGTFTADAAPPTPAPEEQTLDQAAQERQALQDAATKLGGTPQGPTDNALTQVNSALNQAQALIEKH